MNENDVKRDGDCCSEIGCKGPVVLTHVRQVKLGICVCHMGYVVAYENGLSLWTENTGLYRLERDDALKDAEGLRSEIMRQNNM